MARTGRRAVERLMKDLAEIGREPLPHVAALPLENDIFTWHVNILGPEDTPYEGGVFHIKLSFPETYPDDSPSASVVTPIPHPHVINDRICLDLLSDYQGHFDGLDHGVKMTGTGWSSAYTVLQILLQLHTFLMDVEEVGEEALAPLLSRAPSAVRTTLAFSCPECPHRPGSYWPPLPALQLCACGVGDDASQRALEAAVPTEDATETAPHGAAAARPGSTPQPNSLMCFHSKQSWRDGACLGMCVRAQYRGSDRHRVLKSVETAFDVLSSQSFKAGVRLSSTNEEFNEWLPLYVNPEHAERAYPLLLSSLSKISSGSSDVEFQPQMALDVLPKLMSSTIVNLSRGSLHASIKALNGYCALHRLLIYFMEEYPELREKAISVVNKFLNAERCRTKRVVPTLGEFLPLLTIVDTTWEDIWLAYLDECFTRNCLWLLKKYPELDRLDSSITAEERLSKSFQGSIVSYRLLLFHVYFLRKIARRDDMSLLEISAAYDSRNGFADPEQEAALQQKCREIQSVSTWAEFFDDVRPEGTHLEFTDEWLVARLESAMLKSAKRGYHKSKRKSASGTSKCASKTPCMHELSPGGCKFGARCTFSHVVDVRIGSARRGGLRGEHGPRRGAPRGRR